MKNLILNPKKLYSNRIVNAILFRQLGTITHVSTTENVISLTFDDGPHPDTTPELLEILKSHKAHGTFFMLGESARRYPSVVEQVAQEGHAVCNHSYNHPSFPYISSRERRTQMRDCHNALAPYGHRLFRPPYGDLTVTSWLDVLLMRYQVVTWNVVASDWISHEAQWYEDNLITKISPGSIVLFHDTLYQTFGDEFNEDRKTVFEGLDKLLCQLSSTYSFVTVPALLNCGRPERRLWTKKSDVNWLNSLKQKIGTPRRYD